MLTGKGLNWGGSLIRPEATGYGSVYFAPRCSRPATTRSRARRCLVSGSGNVAQFTTCEKLLDLGGKVVTLSDSGGYVYDEDGIDREKLAFVMDLKNNRRGRISEYADKYPNAVYTAADETPTTTRCGRHKADCAFPSATQNEINGKDAANLLAGGVLRGERGRQHALDRPTRVELFIDAGILYGPGKAANAGGVATSGLEMAQNSSA